MPKSLISVAILSLCIFVFRELPHNANLSPVLGLMLIAGFLGKGRWYAYAMPLTAFLLSSTSAAFYPGWIFTILPLLIAVSLGRSMKSQWRSSLAAGFVGAVVFFVISNFGVWATSGMYTPDFSGLIHCYYRGIPFFRVTLTSTLLVTSVFSGIMSVIKQQSSKEVEA